MAKFVPDKAAYLAFTKGPDGPVQRDLAKRAAHLVALAKHQVGKKTGKLASSIGAELRKGPSGPYWRVGSGLKYALAHHEGTRPHVILPKRARMLRFSKGGKIVYTGLVHHPGTRPNRYLTDNLRRIVN